MKAYQDEGEIEQELEHHQKLLAKRRNRLRERELQAAEYGIDVPPHISNEVSSLQEQVKALEEKISSLQGQIKALEEKRREKTRKSVFNKKNKSFIRDILEGKLARPIIIGLLVMLAAISTALCVLVFFVVQLLDNTTRQPIKTSDATITPSFLVSFTSEAMESNTIVPADTSGSVDITSNLSPKEFVVLYYEYINHKRYEEAWSMLTVNYRANHDQGGFAKYRDWWERQGNANPTRIDIISSDGSRGRQIIEVDINYPDQNKIAIYRFEVIYVKGDGWMLNRYCDMNYEPLCSEINM